MKTVDRDRVVKILAAYGGDAACWPDDERAAALRLIAADPTLASARAEAIALDRLLSHAPAGEVSKALLTHILESVPGPATSLHPVRKAAPRGWRVPVFGASLAVRPAAILALAIGVGLGAGVLMPANVDASPAEVKLLADLWGTPGLIQEGDFQ